MIVALHGRVPFPILRDMHNGLATLRTKTAVHNGTAHKMANGVAMGVRGKASHQLPPSKNYKGLEIVYVSDSSVSRSQKKI